MAIKAELDTVYKCQSPQVAAASIQVIGGSVTIKGSNVTEYDPDTKKLIIPTIGDLVDTEDTLGAGIHLVAGLPEWFAFTGSGDVWVKMGVDPRIATGE